MSAAPPPSVARSEGEPHFVYVGGDSSLDLVNTVDWVAGGLENERLTGYERLTRWAVGADVVSPEEAEALRHRTARGSAEAGAAIERARELRAVLQHLFHEVARGQGPGPAWKDFDRWLGEALGRLRVAADFTAGKGAAVARWKWLGADERPDALLWPVVWSAALLLTSAEAHRIRVCDGPDCGWVYVDRSRNRMRRWCQMKTCGTAAKTRRRRRRQA